MGRTEIGNDFLVNEGKRVSIAIVMMKADGFMILLLEEVCCNIGDREEKGADRG